MQDYETIRLFLEQAARYLDLDIDPEIQTADSGNTPAGRPCFMPGHRAFATAQASCCAGGAS